MAIINTELGGTDAADDDVLYAAGLNDTFDVVAHRGKLQEIYTGTGFDSARTSSDAGSDTDDHELTAISAADLVGTNYLIIRILATVASRAINDATCSVTMKIGTKEIGGSYADSLATTNVHDSDTGSSYSDRFDGLKTIEWVHTLTQDEKDDGVQVQITTTCTTGASATSSVTEFTNVQTIISSL